ncbi:hypothetical protein [Catenuloplanes atrovinosus]|uniref:Uncharacterized protein n=1 Tax=Catenuloplanes atrovinosus TaxID=137266 RepID=A0AAE4CCL4_9ACTN|nr:hypothetical protein [Catenuloplanes atrovinosus]MDR7278099.1 hypothetical protein [Catenuloplanes atrovinosus]
MSEAQSYRRRVGRWATIAVVTGAVVAGGTFAANAAVSQQGAPTPSPSQSQSSAASTLPSITVPMTDGTELYVVPVDNADLPGIRFGVMAGRAGVTGSDRDLIVANEVDGSDVAPGFHAVQAATTVDGVPVPQFGYYAGPATKITGIAEGGATVEAVLAETQVGGDRIVLFWFDPATAGTGDVNDLAAFDAAGTALPVGKNTVGHG